MSLVIERPGVVAESFAFSPTAKDALPRFRGRCTVVRLDSIANDILGVPPWSTFAEAWTDPSATLRRRWAENPVVSVGPTDGTDLVLATLTPVVVFGVDNEAVPYARTVIDLVRASCCSVLVIDMGHRLTGHSYADIATFGFDRVRGGALLELLSAA